MSQNANSKRRNRKKSKPVQNIANQIDLKTDNEKSERRIESSIVVENKNNSNFNQGVPKRAKKGRKNRNKNQSLLESNSSNDKMACSNHNNAVMEDSFTEVLAESQDKIMDIPPQISFGNSRPGNLMKEGDNFKRYSAGSEYEDFHTPSVEYNSVSIKSEDCAANSDKDEAQLNKQWEELASFDEDKPEELASFDEDKPEKPTRQIVKEEEQEVVEIVREMELEIPNNLTDSFVQDFLTTDKEILSLNDGKPLKDNESNDIIFSEDVMEDDQLECRLVQSIEVENTDQVNKKMILHCDKKVILASQTSTTNVTSITEESKSPKTKSKHDNFVKKIWKKIKKPKKLKNDSGLENHLNSESECSSISKEGNEENNNNNRETENNEGEIKELVEETKIVDGNSDNFIENDVIEPRIDTTLYIIPRERIVQEQDDNNVDNTSDIVIQEPLMFDETPFKEFDRVLQTFEPEVRIGPEFQERVICLKNDQYNIFQEDSWENQLKREMKYLNDDHLFPDALTPSKIIKFDTPESYDVSFIDDSQYEELWLQEPFLGETKRFNTISINFNAPLASMESLFSSEIKSKPETSMKKPIRNISPFRGKKSFSQFLGCMARSR